MKKTRISKGTVFRVFVLFIIMVIVYWMWSIGSSRFLTHCTSKEVFYSTKENTEFLFPLCGVPCTAYDNTSSYTLFHSILKSYQTFHRSQREKIINGQSVNSLTWYCITGCGGIGDRMKGMYAAFLLALAMNRTFFIYQSEEVQKTMYTEPNAIDWRPVNGCIEMHPDETLELFGHSPHWQRTIFGESDDIHSVIDRMKSKNSIFVSWIRTITNLITSINQSSIAQENKILLKALLLMSQKGLYCLVSTIHQYLFKVPQKVAEAGSSSLAMLNLHPQNFVTVHIRTGFMNSWFGEMALKWDVLTGSRFARTQASWRGMIDCALRIADSVLGNNSLLLVSSDDQEPKDWAVATYGANVRSLDIHPVHVMQHFFPGIGSHSQAYFQNWVELAVMAQSHAIVRIPSGFSDVASHMCSMSPELLYTYSVDEKWCRDISFLNENGLFLY